MGVVQENKVTSYLYLTEMVYSEVIFKVRDTRKSLHKSWGTGKNFAAVKEVASSLTPEC